MWETWQVCVTINTTANYRAAVTLTVNIVQPSDCTIGRVQSLDRRSKRPLTVDCKYHFIGFSSHKAWWCMIVFVLFLIVVASNLMKISQVIGCEGWVFCTSQEIDKEHRL